jgi:predicted transcriptional regulator
LTLYHYLSHHFHSNPISTSSSKMLKNLANFHLQIIAISPPYYIHRKKQNFSSTIIINHPYPNLLNLL